MTLDNDTLDRARTARDRFMDLQHSTEVARVDYHHAIRQLHVAGGSLREIADALGLSHQRIHQIVEPVEGSAGGPHGHAHRMHRRLRGFLPFDRLTHDTRDVIVLAAEEAASLGHRRVGTEHLLISLTAQPAESRVARALAAVGVAREAVVAAVSERLGAGPAGGPGRRPFTPAARRVLIRAIKTASRDEVAPEHLLLALADDGGDAAAVLEGLGASRERVREVLTTL